ncbi:MAG: hypothetical protein AMXMBFR34_28840 [Myxococcaceae bacterium]
MDEKTRKAIYAALCAPFPEACIQRTEGRLTGRGYDTTGIGYQHIVNRLNDVLGIGGFRAHRTVTVKEIKRSNGRPAFEAICDLTLELGHWVDGKFVTFAESLADGGHVASSEADARKGAYTNAFKKAAAFHGVGKAAYEGTLDDDNLPDGDGDPTHPTLVTHKTAGATGASTSVPPPQTPPGYVNTAIAGEVRSLQPERNRLSSKQLAAIWSIARKLGIEQASFRAQIKSRFGCQLEFLNRNHASEVITALNAQLNGNGSGKPRDEHEAAS